MNKETRCNKMCKVRQEFRFSPVQVCRITRGRASFPFLVPQLSLCWWCCMTDVMPAPEAYWPLFLPGQGATCLRVYFLRWAPCPRSGRTPRSAAAGRMPWGRAGRPFCGKCAAAGTSSSDRWTGRLERGAERWVNVRDHHLKLTFTSVSPGA